MPVQLRQPGSVLDTLLRPVQEWAADALGAELVVRIDSATPAVERHAAMKRFNAPDRCGSCKAAAEPPFHMAGGACSGQSSSIQHIQHIQLAFSIPDFDYLLCLTCRVVKQ